MRVLGLAMNPPAFYRAQTAPNPATAKAQLPQSNPHRDSGQRGGGRVPFTEAELTAMRGGLTAEEYRWKTIRKRGKR